MGRSGYIGVRQWRWWSFVRKVGTSGVTMKAATSRYVASSTRAEGRRWHLRQRGCTLADCAWLDRMRHSRSRARVLAMRRGSGSLRVREGERAAQLWGCLQISFCYGG